MSSPDDFKAFLDMEYYMLADTQNVNQYLGCNCI